VFRVAISNNLYLLS